MNREIKFRMWDKIDLQMRPVIQFHIHGDWVSCPVQVNEDDLGLEQRKLEDIELMQFTGLKDVNGKRIYEGDILKTNRNFFSSLTLTGEVYWFNTEQRFGLRDNVYYLNSKHEYEIIGNIYENPNLLEK